MQSFLDQQSVRVLRATGMLLLGASVALTPACKKKKPNIPPASTAPTITVPETKPETPPPTTTAPTTTEPAPSTAPAESTTTTTPTTKPKPKHHATHKPKPAAPPAQPSQQQSAKNNASTTSGGEAMTISPDLPKDELDSQKRATEQMLQNAETNLRKLNRQLSDGEQNMARQVRNYITQSRLATQDGDLERAHNLAVKAQLLSSELVK
jgi:outer membrane biosynthesis protein TonB